MLSLRPVPSIATAALGAALATPTAAAEHVVRMAGATYVPAEVTAAVGDTLRFVNDDTTDHNVFVPTLGHAVDLGRSEPADEKTLPLLRAGAFEVECVLHEGMTATVDVTR